MFLVSKSNAEQTLYSDFLKDNVSKHSNTTLQSSLLSETKISDILHNHLCSTNRGSISGGLNSYCWCSRTLFTHSRLSTKRRHNKINTMHHRQNNHVVPSSKATGATEQNQSVCLSVTAKIKAHIKQGSTSSYLQEKAQEAGIHDMLAIPSERKLSLRSLR